MTGFVGGATAAGVGGWERPGKGGTVMLLVDWEYEGGAAAGVGAGEGLLLLLFRERLEKALAAEVTAGGGFCWKRAAMELTPPPVVVA